MINTIINKIAMLCTEVNISKINYNINKTILNNSNNMVASNNNSNPLRNNKTSLDIKAIKIRMSTIID